MAWNRKKFKVYAKLGGIFLALLAALLFILQNRESTPVKFLWLKWESSLWLLMVFSALAGILIFWIARRIRGVFNEMSQVRREEQTRSKLVQDIKGELGSQKSKEQGESQ